MLEDAGVSRRALAAAAGIDAGYLSQLFALKREPSLAVLVALAETLNADLSLRLYPRGEPRLRDRLQAPIVESLCRVAHSRWRRSLEVAVRRPARGWIDAVFDTDEPAAIVAAEVQSRVDRLEQFLRWSGEKAASLASADIWPMIQGAPVHRLLVLRSTPGNRQLVDRYEATLTSAYPAPAAAAYDALTGPTGAWPGSAILWASPHASDPRILPTPPRGVVLGR
jgi:transcriptional regulator with XRE-family HTH domain